MDKWLTVAAQIVNFLILVWLLKRFLYGRILKAMDDRQAKIAKQLSDAEEQRSEAEQSAAAFRQKSQDIDAQREEMLAKAKADAEAHRAKLMKEARAEVDALETRWRDSVERQQAAFLQDLRQRATKQTLAIARKVLGDLADAPLEARILDVFLARLDSLPDDEWQALAASLGDDPDAERELVVRTVFDLSDEVRGRLSDVVRARVGDGIGVRFETVFDPVCGIELRGRGRKVAWSIDHYLDTLGESLAEAMDQLPSPVKLQGERERDEERSAVSDQQSAEEEEDEEEDEQEQEPEQEQDEEEDDDG